MYELRESDYKAVLDLVTSLVHVKSIDAFAEMLINSKQQIGFDSVTMLELTFHKTCTHRLIFTDNDYIHKIDSFIVPKDEFDRDTVYPQILSGKEVIRMPALPDYINELVMENKGIYRNVDRHELTRYILSRFNKDTNTANLLVFAGAGDELHKKMATMAGYLHVHLMSAYVRIMGAGERMEERLSEREQSVLTWLRYGKTSWEVAKILNITENTVNFHIKNIKRKLNATNRQHAVAIAIAKGILE